MKFADPIHAFTIILTGVRITIVLINLIKSITNYFGDNWLFRRIFCKYHEEKSSIDSKSVDDSIVKLISIGIICMIFVYIAREALPRILFLWILSHNRIRFLLHPQPPYRYHHSNTAFSRIMDGHLSRFRSEFQYSLVNNCMCSHRDCLQSIDLNYNKDPIGMVGLYQFHNFSHYTEPCSDTKIRNIYNKNVIFEYIFLNEC